jgi:hypothetical protein
MRLSQDIGLVTGGDLFAHLQRDAVWVVANGASLLEAALAVSTDQTSVVQAWIADGTLRRPTDQERADWPSDERHGWLALVVRPFVLVQVHTTKPVS